MTKLEQVARAIYLSDHGCDGFPDQEDAMQQAYIAMARAAVEALREADQDIVSAMPSQCPPGDCSPVTFRALYRGAIDSILSEKPE